MNLLKFIGKVAVFVLQMLAYGWRLFLVRCLERLIATVKKFLAFLKLSHSEQERVADKCCKFTNPAYHRPDPCIYDQCYLRQLGLAVTWDNPDVTLLSNGVVVAKQNLLPNTQYEIDADYLEQLL